MGINDLCFTSRIFQLEIGEQSMSRYKFYHYSRGIENQFRYHTKHKNNQLAPTREGRVRPNKKVT